MRNSIHLILALVLAVTCWPTTSFGQAGNLLMRQNMMNQQRMMQQQRMQQQRMQQQRQMRQRQQQAQRRQMAEQRRRQQAAMQQRQRQMQVRKQQMVAQRQKMAEQRRIQQQRRQQEMQRKQAQRQQAVQKQTQQTARVARDRAVRLQRERRLLELRKRTRLQQQQQQGQKAAQETSTAALLSRTANRAAIIKSPNFAKSRQESSKRFSKLRAGRPASPAAAGSGNGNGGNNGGKKPGTLANKQFQQQKLQEFRNRQALRGAKDTKQDVKSKNKVVSVQKPTSRASQDYSTYKKALKEVSQKSVIRSDSFGGHKLTVKGAPKAILHAKLSKGQLKIENIQRGELPSGAGSAMIAKLVREKQMRPKQVVLSNVVNRKTLSQLDNGVPAAQTTLGKMVSRSMHLNGQKVYKFDMIKKNGKVDIVAHVR